MDEIFSAVLVLVLCVIVVFMVSRCWIALVDGIGRRLFGRFRKPAEKAWHPLDTNAKNEKDDT